MSGENYDQEEKMSGENYDQEEEMPEYQEDLSEMTYEDYLTMVDNEDDNEYEYENDLGDICYENDSFNAGVYIFITPVGRCAIGEEKG